MSNIVDLDVILPPSAIIKFDGKEVTVQPPTVAETIRLGLLVEILDDRESTVHQIQKALDEVTAFMYKHVPELNGRPLNKSQIAILLNVIIDLNTPKEKKELEAKGISTGIEKKAS